MQEADHIAIPLLDGEFALSQVARIEDGRMLVYMTRTKTALGADTKPLIEPQIVSGLCVKANAVTDSQWTIIGYGAVPRISPFYQTALSDMDPLDPAIIEAFANAIHGLYPWDGFPDPQFFNTLLRHLDVMPTNARLHKDMPDPT